jgi:CheY-like chemotaxis protein
VVDVDPARIMQVLSNVLHNAAKFTPSPGTVRITSGLPHPTEPVVEVRVSDTGIGISSDMLPRVFELFAQAEAATERSHGGLGIGLALAHRLLALHGGTITAQSDGPGTGSTFTITLPVSHAAPAVSSPHVDAPMMNGRVVIVDDNQDAARTMAMLVEKLGGSARTAYDAESGISAVRAFRPDIVLLDIGMPGMDGYEACRRIRQQPSERPVIVVAVTGWGQDQDKQRALDAGFDAHLTKPVDPAALAQLLAGSPVG